MFRSGVWTLRIALVAALVVAASAPASAQHGRVVGGHSPVHHGGYHHVWTPHPYHYVYYNPLHYYVYFGAPYYIWRYPYAYPRVVVVNSPTYVPYYSYYYSPQVYVPTIYVPSNPSIQTANVVQAAPSAVAPATIEVHVPTNAEVWFDDTPTDQAGEWRTFTSPPLPPDQVFYYKVRARWNDNGNTVEQTRTI
jgi:uncharacterized protein (TIGR03000 family)